MNFREKSVMFLATGCFIGNIPFAPGTFGTILGLPLCFLLSRTNFSIAVLLAAIFIIFAILIAHDAEKILKKDDPGCIVIDEIAGLMVVLFGLPFNVIYASAGFAIFRFFDIAKVFLLHMANYNFAIISLGDTVNMNKKIIVGPFKTRIKRWWPLTIINHDHPSRPQNPMHF